MIKDEDILHEVNQSLNRCFQHGSFFDKLCSNLKIANVPAPAFLGHQPKLLKEDLVRLLMSTAEIETATEPSRLNVAPPLAKFWIDALMTTVRDFDDKFTPELERKWRIVLKKSMASMRRINVSA
jgi:hypothetical protein